MKSVRGLVAVGAVAVALLATSGIARADDAGNQVSYADGKLKLGSVTIAPEIDVRLRGEYRREPPDVAASVTDVWAVLTRARLGLAVSRGPLTAKVTVQDARIMGDSGALQLARSRTQVVPSFGVYEAYLESKTDSARPSYVRLGRQAVTWGEGRLLSSADFSPAGRTLDAARFAWAPFDDLDFEALAVVLASPGPLGQTSGDTTSSQSSGAQLFGLRAGYDHASWLKVELFGYARTAFSDRNLDQPTDFAVSRAKGEKLTASLRLSGEGSGFSYGLEGAVQGGAARALAGTPTIGAFAFAGHAEKRFDGAKLSPTLRVLGGYASGDPGKGGTYTQFDPLLPDTQRWHGALDVFAFSNLADVGGQVEIEPFDDASLRLGYRYAAMADRGGEWISSSLGTLGRARTAGADDSSSLGHELSARFGVEPIEGLTLGFSYAALVYGDGAKQVLGRGASSPVNANAPEVPDTTHYAFTEVRVRLP